MAAFLQGGWGELFIIIYTQLKVIVKNKITSLVQESEESDLISVSFGLKPSSGCPLHFGFTWTFPVSDGLC